MKTVLAYGDSLTWGYDPVSLGRHAYEDRWTSVLQKALGHGVRVIAEGLNGRTTAYDDHLGDCERNGVKLLPTILATHKPIDLVIIMLGTNDLKRGIQGTAIGATSGAKRLVKQVQKHDWGFEFEEPEILIVAPPPIRETANSVFGAMFNHSVGEGAMLAGMYRDAADEAGCAFFDAGSVAETTPLDGIHLDAENTRAIGRGLEPIVRMMLGL
ncbi:MULTISPECIES: SGNH/GDSL hydrolase family protein [Rhizobiaceae]|uniref:SGNH/GDSL hydrolase family protein n=1 Tax=Peteryoungia algae TaxID=2919917 RepID=A0ABT0D191_9HYPH|nr:MULTISPECIES: SGNH/GDSL hydrolase family protein [unclassified Rhizobium]MCC8933314.1 SGNH/GDSL hydrolase family protein [Rhizobium sp. 'Codium 1']MCJ8239192.1 SGNH/GDSL hydrolase family protein [Rhizobium sp. SSM4.3]